ncbi:acetyltransferase [Uruburuella testudinis]|uniref:Acetyltransferase n=1 Tax=Uruburuella testudinis TaxID=1282863 RepID=A0ABY4DVW4_9NEIS|nr:acetyltransferase [Uruburuella testudinis]UOO82973.1 acetyltransferase [Uruburuella testudinis]
MKSSNLYIYGGGGHGQVVADIARLAGYRNICFLDDAHGRKFDASLPKGDIIVAIGNNAVRQRLCKKVTAAGFRLINLVHPSAIISPNATFGIGVVVMPLAVVNAGARIGDGAIINTASVVEHDCIIGVCAHICPRAALAGNVTVGDRAQMGIGSCAIQGLKIGAGSIVGAGSVVVKNIASDVVTFGSPAQVYRKLA